MSDPRRKVAGEVDRFDDVFHGYDDDLDEGTDADVDFLEHFSEWSKNEDDPQRPGQVADAPADEQQLSQKLSQLFTTTTEESTTTKRSSLTPVVPESSTKKFKGESTEASAVSELPAYLSAEQTTFEEIVTPYLQKNASTLTVNELRELAALEHQVAFSHLQLSLWRTFYESGKGQLIDDEKAHAWRTAVAKRTRVVHQTTPRIWPDKLSSIVEADPNVVLKPNETLVSRFEGYVRERVRTFKEQYLAVQKQLKERKDQLQSNFTAELEEVIRQFVEQYGIALHRLMIESQIVAVKYDYYDRLVTADFYNEHPYIEQIKRFEELSQTRLTLETTKMDVAVLKQRLAHQYFADLFRSFHMPAPQAFATIADPQTQQHLTARFEQLRQRTQSEMMIIHIRAAEAKVDECQQKFDIEFKRFEQDQRNYRADAKLTETMYFIMKERFKYMDERLRTLYDIKVRFFAKAPTVKTSI